MSDKKVTYNQKIIVDIDNIIRKLNAIHKKLNLDIEYLNNIWHDDASRIYIEKYTNFEKELKAALKELNTVKTAWLSQKYNN